MFERGIWFGWLALWVAIGLSPIACHPHPWDQPHDGWLTIGTPHFIVHTDTRERVWKGVVDRLEEAHAALAVAFFPRVEPGPVEVLLLSSRDFTDLLGEDRAGLYAPGVGSHGGLMVVRDGGTGDRLEQTAAHELAHLFLAERCPAIPAWLAEGVAGYLETIRVRAGHVEVGHFFPQVSRPKLTLVSLRDLAHTDHAGFYRGSRRPKYEAAKLFVHWLLHGNPGNGIFTVEDRWQALLKPFTQEQFDRESPDALMARVFPELTWSEIQTRVEEHAFRLRNTSIPMFKAIPFSRPVLEPPSNAPANPTYIKLLAQALLAARKGQAISCYKPGSRTGAAGHRRPDPSTRRDADYQRAASQAMDRQAPSARECAEVIAATAKVPVPTGQFSLFLRIGAEGTPDVVDVVLTEVDLSEEESKRLSICLAEVACEWRFPRPPAEIDAHIARSFTLAKPRAAGRGTPP